MTAKDVVAKFMADENRPRLTQYPNGAIFLRDKSMALTVLARHYGITLTGREMAILATAGAANIFIKKSRDAGFDYVDESAQLREQLITLYLN